MKRVKGILHIEHPYSEPEDEAGQCSGIVVAVVAVVLVVVTVIVEAVVTGGVKGLMGTIDTLVEVLE